MIANKQIFITGGAGFIGSALIGRLVDHNRIIVYDTLSRNALKDKPYKDHPNLTLIRGDVLDFAHLSETIQGADIIVHCAAIAGIDTVIKSPVRTMQVNMVGSANVLEAAACLSRCDRVVCFSTKTVRSAPSRPLPSGWMVVKRTLPPTRGNSLCLAEAESVA